MTEYSKQSRNRAAPTDSNTGERSKQPQTHPYSADIQSPSYSPEGSGQPESPDEPQYNYEISQAYIVPLVASIKEENLHLKQQKGQVEQEMQALHHLSKAVLTENQQLRKHYTARTQDIRRIIETITLNTHEEHNDLSHESFLLRESNCALVKQIEVLMKQTQTGRTSNSHVQTQIDLLARQNMVRQQNLRDITVNNRQLVAKCDKARNEAGKDSRTAEEAITTLLSQVTLLKNTNRKNLREAKNAQQDHNHHRPLFESNLNAILGKIAELGLETQQLRDASQIAAAQLETQRQAYEHALAAATQALSANERARDRANDIQHQLSSRRALLVEAKANFKKKGEQLRQLGNRKLQLISLIQAKKQSLRKIESAHHQSLGNSQTKYRLRLKQVRQWNNRQMAALNEEAAKIAPEIETILSSIDVAREEYASLVQEVDEKRQIVDRLENPLKQLLRLEYEWKRKNQKQ